MSRLRRGAGAITLPAMRALIRFDRDLRVDLVRGFALWAIFVNHTPGNWLGYVTPRNYTLADATEAFVMLAGYAAGLAYGIVMDRQGWFFAASRVLGRDGQTPPSGRVSTEHVINVLGRLQAQPLPETVATNLQVSQTPLADTARYDSLRAGSDMQEADHA